MREQGRLAALAEEPVDSNPYALQTEEAKEWEGGWRLGNQERVDAETAKDPANKRKPRGKPNLSVVPAAAAPEAQAAVH